MKEELAGPFICLISFGVIALFILMIRGRKARVSRHPDKVIRRIKTITKPMKLRKEFRKWSNPEIRQAAANQLTESEAAKLLAMLRQEEQKEFLSYIKDIERLEAIRAAYSGADSSQISKRICDLYVEKISACTDPNRLARVIRENDSTYIRTEALNKLKDRKTVEETAVWAASVSDEKMLQLLLEKLDNPESGLSGSDGQAGGNTAARIAEDPTYEPAIRKAAVSHIWDVETLDRLKEDSALCAACVQQRYEAICHEEGHQWEVVPGTDDVWDAEPYRLKEVGRALYVIPDYRCRKCGLTRKGERNRGEWILKYSS